MTHDGGTGEVRINRIEGSTFSIGGSDITNTTVHHGGTGADAPGAAELLEAVRELRIASSTCRAAPTVRRSTPNWTRPPASWRRSGRSGPACPPGCGARSSGGPRWWNR